MTDLIKEIVSVLALVAGAAVLVLFLLAVGSVLVRAYRVGYQRRPLLLTFAGSDDSRAALTTLFATQLRLIEKEWARLVGAVRSAQTDFKAEYDIARQPSDATSRSRGDVELAAPADLPPGQRSGLGEAGNSPRTVGEEPIDDVLELESDQNTLADMDIGTVSVAGVSFSPQAILALVRRLPGACARRRISGTLAQFGDTAVIAATFEERGWRRGSATSIEQVVIVEGDWLAAINTLAFRVQKGRLGMVGALGDAKKATAAGGLSRTAKHGFLEAETWEACKAFLAGYERHFRHFVSGAAADRDRAIELYTRAIDCHPNFTLAHYNRGTLLYNRYRRAENERAVEDFELATKSEDPRLRALAFAGLVVAYGQQVHRFDVRKEAVVANAEDASRQALQLDPGLEESWFAAGWALQIDERWNEAHAAYLDIDKLKSTSVPGKRIKSFAYNNAAWIGMTKLSGDRQQLLRDAKRLLAQAVDLYPNKIAYANLAAIARERRKYGDAERLFEHALELDPKYVNGWHEFALLELERSQRARQNRDTHAERSRRYQQTAERLADDHDRRKIRRAFEKAQGAYATKTATV